MKLMKPVPGGPCWVELSTSDVPAAQAFYAAVFGWRSETDPRPEAGGYTMARISEDAVAALTPAYRRDQPPSWTVSFATEDVDASADAVRSAGGTVLMGPMDVFDQGRFAVAADPSGAAFGLWQGRAFPGAGRFNSPGALGWTELRTPDPQGALAFYPAVFGWTVEASEHFTHWGVDGAAFGGLKEQSPDEAEETGPHWLPYFTVTDTETTAATVLSAGGEQLAPPRHVPGGPWVAVVRDPRGAGFGLRTP
ncbi:MULTISPECIES: VOC family protein [unclassified Streptomyces]|uniref:VOC family protein n=1 Tax=unclassified Streptomyces TaxID=2593676 RepID=UPI00093F69FF|nr:VOC family protein [Streptomyces sp. CB02058]OKI94326.1 hydroxylase [Streptomyces sp. CB02058]